MATPSKDNSSPKVNSSVAPAVASPSSEAKNSGLPFAAAHTQGYSTVYNAPPPFVPGFYVIKIQLNETLPTQVVSGASPLSFIPSENLNFKQLFLAAHHLCGNVPALQLLHRGYPGDEREGACGAALSGALCTGHSSAHRQGVQYLGGQDLLPADVSCPKITFKKLKLNELGLITWPNMKSEKAKKLWLLASWFWPLADELSSPNRIIIKSETPFVGSSDYRVIGLKARDSQSVYTEQKILYP